MKKQKLSDREIAERFDDNENIHRVLQKSIHEAVLKHKKLGNPVCTWKNGKVVWIQPEDICIDPD